MGEVIGMVFQSYFKSCLNLMLLQNHSADSGILQLNTNLVGVLSS